MEIIYIGEIPPPYGGITVKNELLLRKVFRGYEVDYIDVKEKQIILFIKLVMRFIKCRFCKKPIFIGIGGKRRLHKLLLLIYIFGGTKVLKCTSVIDMASTLSEYCEKNRSIIFLLERCAKVYMELNAMLEDMSQYKLVNCSLLPNCRDGLLARKPHEINMPVRLLFFSRINRAKGVPIVFEMAKELDDNDIEYSIDFWGEIDDIEYEDEFLENIKQHPKCKYCGIFDVVKDDLYKKMNEYDVFLLPTTWLGESCCGAIIESKMAGIPAIVNDWHYNKEMVLPGEGYVLDVLSGKSYAECIIRLIRDEDLYRNMAQKAYASRTRYDYDTYIAQIEKDIQYLPI